MGVVNERAELMVGAHRFGRVSAVARAGDLCHPGHGLVRGAGLAIQRAVEALEEGRAGGAGPEGPSDLNLVQEEEDGRRVVEEELQDGAFHQRKMQTFVCLFYFTFFCCCFFLF